MLAPPVAERDKPLIEAELFNRKALELYAGKLKCLPEKPTDALPAQR
jgi:hypothetical protein